MRNLGTFSMLVFLCTLLTGCSNSNGEEDDGMDTIQIEGPIIGSWVATSLGVGLDDGTEDEVDNPCGTFQKYRFSSDGTVEVDHYTPGSSGCNFSLTRTGVFEEVGSGSGNYRVTLTRIDDMAEDVRLPQISFDGNDTMRLQYLWDSTNMDNISYSFVVYQRE